MGKFKAMRSQGTQLKIKIGDEVIAVAGLTSISGLDLSADFIESTALDSDGGYREYIAGFKDAGEVSVEGHFLVEEGAGQSDLYDLYETGEEAPFIIAFPPKTKTEWQFDGIVTNFSTSAATDDLISFSCTIRVTGKPSLVFNSESLTESSLKAMEAGY